MKKITLFALSMLLILAACKKDEDPKLSLDKSEITLQHDKTGQLTANMDCTWISSDIKVATVSTTGLVTGNLIGDAIITAKSQGGNIEATCAVHITPVSVLFKEPYFVYGASSSLTKLNESRLLKAETATGLIYYGENSNVRFVMYTFATNAMTSAIVLLQNTTSVTSESVTFMTERYSFYGYSDGFYMFKDGNGTIMAVSYDDSLGLNVLYFHDTGKKNGNLLYQIKENLNKFK